MMGNLRYVSIAGAFLMSTAPAVWAQNSTANYGHNETQNKSGELTQRLEQYTHSQHQTHGNAVNLTQRMEQYGAKDRQQAANPNARTQTGSSTAPATAGNNAGK